MAARFRTPLALTRASSNRASGTAASSASSSVSRKGRGEQIKERNARCGYLSYRTLRALASTGGLALSIDDLTAASNASLEVAITRSFADTRRRLAG